jgi:glucose-1-phosphate adenylyltransferase
MDYRPFIETHRDLGAEVPCAVRTVPLEEAHRFGILDVDATGRVTAFVEKPEHPPSNLVSMGVYVFSWPAMRDLLGKDRPDFGRDVLPWMVEQGRGVYAYEFGGYWQDVGTVESYWATSLDLLSDDPGIDLNDLGWLVYTKSEERPPAWVGSEARVTRSMVSHGCVVDGIVERSILSPGVRVEAGAVVRDSIVMFDAVIGEGAVLDRAIVDKEARIGPGARVGSGDEMTPNRDEPERLSAGITLVGKRANVPAGVEIGRNCRIDPGVGDADFGRRRRIRSGESVRVGGRAAAGS